MLEYESVSAACRVLFFARAKYGEPKFSAPPRGRAFASGKKANNL